MNSSAPSTAESLAFYKAAIAAAAYLDQQTLDQNLFGPQGDSAWRAYGDDLPLVIRVDTVLRKLAILYPMAFDTGSTYCFTATGAAAPSTAPRASPPARSV